MAFFPPIPLIRKNHIIKKLTEFFPPIPLIRKNHIIKKLTESNAFSEETAKTFLEAGIINPNGFNKINERLIKQKVLVKTKDGKYYLNK